MSNENDQTGHDTQQRQQPQPSSGNGSGQGAASAYERMRSQRDNRAKESPDEGGHPGGRPSGIS
jgi:hypothetical protein